jgi:hypothetical protein
VTRSEVRFPTVSRPVGGSRTAILEAARDSTLGSPPIGFGGVGANPGSMRMLSRRRVQPTRSTKLSTKTWLLRLL